MVRSLACLVDGAWRRVVGPWEVVGDGHNVPCKGSVAYLVKCNNHPPLHTWSCYGVLSFLIKNVCPHLAKIFSLMKISTYLSACPSCPCNTDLSQGDIMSTDRPTGKER